MPRRPQPAETISRYENMLKGELVSVLHNGLSGSVVFAHQDLRTPGIPDLSVNWQWKSWWVECKHAVPSFDTYTKQELTMLRLAHQGFARYIIWIESKTVSKQTWIVHPEIVFGKNGVTKQMAPEVSCAGFDHNFVLEYIKSHA